MYVARPVSTTLPSQPCIRLYRSTLFIRFSNRSLDPAFVRERNNRGASSGDLRNRETAEWHWIWRIARPWSASRDVIQRDQALPSSRWINNSGAGTRVRTLTSVKAPRRVRCKFYDDSKEQNDEDKDDDEVNNEEATRSFADCFRQLLPRHRPETLQRALVLPSIPFSLSSPFRFRQRLAPIPTDQRRLVDRSYRPRLPSKINSSNGLYGSGPTEITRINSGTITRVARASLYANEFHRRPSRQGFASPRSRDTRPPALEDAAKKRELFNTVPFFHLPRATTSRYFALYIRVSPATRIFTQDWPINNGRVSLHDRAECLEHRGYRTGTRPFLQPVHAAQRRRRRDGLIVSGGSDRASIWKPTNRGAGEREMHRALLPCSCPPPRRRLSYLAYFISPTHAFTSRSFLSNSS